MVLVTETANNIDDTNFLLDMGYTFLEASSDKSTIIHDNVYTKVANVLSTPEGKKKFSNLIGAFVNRNTDILTAIGPTKIIYFTPSDKDGFFKLFDIDPKDIQKYVTEITKKMNGQSAFRFLRENPIYTLLYCPVRYYTINKDQKGLNEALMILTLSHYPSIYTKYFKFDPNPYVMHYTIDNMTNAFYIKKSGSLLAALMSISQSSWKFHEKDIIMMDDGYCMRFTQRMRSDFNSFMKNITREYMKNKEKGLSIQTQVDQYEDNNIEVNPENDTNKVENVTNAVVMKILQDGQDLAITDTASSITQVSKLDLRNYIGMIINKKNDADMKKFIESILFIYLYDQNHRVDEIHSREFLSYAIALFKRTHSYDKNVRTMKDILDKWGNDTGVYKKYSRLATRIDYTKAFFYYFILSIQKYA